MKISQASVEELVGRGKNVRVVCKLVLDEPCRSTRDLAAALCDVLEDAELDDADDEPTDDE